MNNEKLKLTGHIHMVLRDSKGNVKTTRDTKNVVVTAGKTFLANWLTSATQSDFFMQYLALGTGSTAANSADTTLDTEISTRVAGSLTNNTNIWQNQGTFGAGVATGAITEAGIFSASSGGTMLARQVFAVVNKAAGDSLQVTWQITLS